MPFALIMTALDNLLLDNTTRKYATYLELGWDEESIREFLGKKENILKVASFNTMNSSFRASSRRNRFYEIYNRPDMMVHDTAIPGAIEGIAKLGEKFEIFVITSREEKLADNTEEIMEKLGFPMEKMTIKFKPKHVPIERHIRETFKSIKLRYKKGVSVCLHPEDAQFYQRQGYTPIAFTFIKECGDFQGHINIVCQDWNQIISSLT